MNIPDGAQLVAIVLDTMYCNTKVARSVHDNELADTALQWQRFGRLASALEMHGAMHGVENGRMTEFAGRIASAGEQLGLAATASRDAKRWLDSERASTGWMVAARATTEISGYFAISAAHGLANVTLRMLMFNPTSAAIIKAEHKRAGGFAPFSDARAAWQPINVVVAGTIDVAAASVGKPAVEALAGCVSDLAKDVRWQTLVAHRDVDFHRWRSQTMPGGVAQENPWETDGETSSMTVYAQSTHEVPDPEHLARDSDEGLEALSIAMRGWMAKLPEALRDLGVPALEIPESDT